MCNSVSVYLPLSGKLMIIAILLGWQRWQSRVADFFCYFWAVFSKRTFLTKSVVWKGAQQTLSIPPAAAEGLQVHFNMGPSTMPRRQPKSVPESMLWRRLQEQSFSIEKNRRVLEGLTDRFVGWFCATAKSTTSMAVFWHVFHRRLNPRQAVSKFQVQHWNPPWNWNQVCLPFFCHVWGIPGAWQPLLWKSQDRLA